MCKMLECFIFTMLSYRLERISLQALVGLWYSATPAHDCYLKNKLWLRFSTRETLITVVSMISARQALAGWGCLLDRLLLVGLSARQALAGWGYLLDKLC